MSQQLTLNIMQPLAFAFDTFVEGSNHQLVARLKMLSTGGLSGNIYIWGEQGSGKSHLLQAVCQQCQQSSIQGIYLNCRQLLELPAEAIEGLEHMDLVALDDIDALAGHQEWEEAMFHFYNRAQIEHTSLVFSAVCSPQVIAVQLPDLKTRLNAAETYRVNRLGDVDKHQLLTQAAEQRGFYLNDEVANFIMQRSDRDMASLHRIIEHLDHSSLTEQRKITVPFVKKVLGI
ncbi:MAG: DnaA regulatory inactivator Hda [Gammaproteobacteria bacterium]|nr:MAG: DnaA regulatory inactivator Hda [Gammaproteobacteria bacterium]